MNEIQLSELLERYFNNVCTPEEEQVIDNWLELYEYGADFTESLSDEKKEQLKHRMFRTITDHVVIKEPKAPVIMALYKTWWIRIAAAAVLLVFTKVLIIDKLSPIKPAESAFAEIIIANRTKNIIKQILPDSSIVWLSPDASLSYPKMFQSKSRNVAMQGECFFEITKNPRHPFIINSEHMLTQVWGTSFRILDNKNIKAARVTVLTGKVSVSKKHNNTNGAETKLLSDEVILYPKQEAVYNRYTELLIASRRANISALKIYTHVDFSFENARLTEIVTVLNQKFNAHIRIQDEDLSKAVMTADLSDLNLPEILEVLKTSMKLNYEVTEDVIVLKKTN